MTRISKKKYIYHQVQATDLFFGGGHQMFFLVVFFGISFKKKSLVSFVQFGSWMKIRNVFSVCQVRRRLKRKTNHWNPILPVKGQREIFGSHWFLSMVTKIPLLQQMSAFLKVGMQEAFWSPWIHGEFTTKSAQKKVILSHLATGWFLQMDLKWSYTTVDGRNPAPPGMHKAL